jgi:hypothetical protein
MGACCGKTENRRLPHAIQTKKEKEPENFEKVVKISPLTSSLPFPANNSNP